MTFDIQAVKERAERAGNPKEFCGDCGLRIATQEHFDSTGEGEGADLCWGDFGDCAVVFGISANWRIDYATDVSVLISELERLRSVFR